MLRLLGLVYLMAFLTLVNQGRGLIGAHGLEPAADFLDEVAAQLGGRAAGFMEMPTLFWLGASDGFIAAVGWVGVALSLAVVAGYANALVLAALCVLQISVAAVGQDFYAFGWELQLVETGFICIFLCPLLDGRPFPRRPPPAPAVWLLCWVAMKVMWGAGLIKLRGDPCWRDLTCLDFHFETQPIPNPLSAAFHHLPAWAHKLGVLFNHVVELAAPFFMFGPRRLRHVAGALMAGLQIVLIASGNLSFLNWLTLVPILACFDDGLWRRVLPRRLVARAERARAAAIPSRAQGAAVAVFAVAVALLSIPVVVNMLSGKQAMNTSFTRVPLVNTYGAFGSVGRERDQLVFEGTMDEEITARDDLARVRMEMPAGRSGAPPVLDEPLPLSSRLAALVRGDGGARRRAVVGEPGLEAARSGSNGARSARDRSVRRHAAPPHPRRSLSLSLRAPGRGRAGGRASGSPPGCRPSRATTRSCRSTCAGAAGCAT